MRVVLALAVLLASCQKAGPKPAPEPADLLFVVSVASPKEALARGAAYVDAISPGAGKSLTADAALEGLRLATGAPGLDGLDLDRPAAILFLDPKKHPRPVVLAAAVADEAKVKATTGAAVRTGGGRAAIGDAPALDAAGAYALSLTAAPEQPTLRLAPGKLLERYRAEIDTLRKELGGTLGQIGAGSPAVARILEWEIDLLLRLAEQTEEARLVVDASAGEASLEIVLVPRAGTPFAAFNAAQEPGVDTRLLERLPPVEKSTMVMVGRYRLGPARDLVLDAVTEMLQAATGKPQDRARWAAWLDLFGGDMAVVSWQDEGGAMQMHELFDVSDGAKAAAVARELLVFDGEKTVDIAGFKMTWLSRAAAAAHAGAEISEIAVKLDLDGFPEMQRELMRRMYGEDGLRVYSAGKDKLYAVTLGTQGLEAMRRVLDGGEGKVAPAAAAALDQARKREASIALFFDMAQSFAPIVGRALPPSASGMLVEASFRGGPARLRFSVPSAHVKEITAALGR
jgi:hypothetical protein